MKNTAIIAAAMCCAALLSCNKTVSVAPTITLNDNKATFEAPIEGGTRTVNCSVSGIYKGWSMTAEPTVDWITGVTTSPGQSISFTVESNEDGPDRTGSILVTCTNPGGSAVTAELIVRQAGSAAATYYADDTFDVCYIRNISTSDDGTMLRCLIRFSDDPNFTALSYPYRTYTLAITFPMREDGSNLPADGTYTAWYGNDKPMTFDISESYFFWGELSEEFNTSYLYFLSGEISVTSAPTIAGDASSIRLTIEGTLTDEFGHIYHFVYN